MVVLLVPLGVILAIVALAAAQQNHAWADAIVRGFTAWIVKIPLVGDAIERLIISGATWVANKLGHYFLAKAARIINWVGGLGHYVWMIANATLDWPVELVTFARWLLTSELPHLIGALPNAVTKLVHDAERAIGGLERDFAKLYAHLPGTVRKLIAAALAVTVGPFLLPLRWLLHHWRQIAHAAAYAGGIAVPWVAVPKIWHRLYSQNLRLSRVEKLLGVSAFALVLSRVLRVTPRCLTNGNIGRTARALCGVPTHLLNDLLGLLADIWLLENVCVLLPFLETAAADIGAPLVGALTDVTAGLCKGSIGAAKPLQGPTPTVPPFMYVSPLAV